MRIVSKLLEPSRPDAERLKRSEKMAMLHLMYSATILEDLCTDISDRLEMVEDGPERMRELADKSDAILQDLRVTVPENQRVSMQNVAKDCEMRITPKSTPVENNVIMTKNEFKELVECARAKCHECIEDDEECTKCQLYQLLTSVLPLEDYHAMNMCPYNLGRWAN